MKVKLIVFLLTIIPILVKSQNPREELSKKIDSLIKKSPFEGFAIGIVNDNSLLYSKGFGFADKENNIPYSENTVHPIGSISKTLIGVSLMKAVELGLVELDKDINKYLSFKVENPHHPGIKITLRHLATHTSGLKDGKVYEKSYVYKEKIPALYRQKPIGVKKMMLKKYQKFYNSNIKLPMDDFLMKIYSIDGQWYKKSNFYNKAPGEAYNYSNNGAALAALIIENVSGMTYAEFVKKHILDPLQMNKTGWDLNSYSNQEKASFYFNDYKLPEYELITYPDGGLITNVNDFSKYLMAMIKGFKSGENKILNSSSLNELFKLQINDKFHSGLFWEVGEKAIGHTGGDPGVSTLSYFYKKEGIGYIVFTNTSDRKKLGDYFKQLFNILKVYGPKINDNPVSK